MKDRIEAELGLTHEIYEARRQVKALSRYSEQLAAEAHAAHARAEKLEELRGFLFPKEEPPYDRGAMAPAKEEIK